MGRRRTLPPLGALRAFEAAARHLSFRRAAEELAVSPAAVSHQIRGLEDRLGARLFVRHVRRVALTQTGVRLYPTLRDGFDAFEAAIKALSPHGGRRSVTLTATTLFTARRLLPALGAFSAANPDLDLRLHASDAVADLAAGAADIAVRYSNGAAAGLIAEPLATERFGVVCSPKLGVVAPHRLYDTTLLHIEWKRPGDDPDWRRWSRLAGMTDLAVDHGPRFTDDGHALQAAVAGHGAAVASLELARPEIEAGLLIHPFGPVMTGDTYHIVATPQALAGAEVQAVRRWLRDAVGDAPPAAI